MNEHLNQKIKTILQQHQCQGLQKIAIISVSENNPQPQQIQTQLAVTFSNIEMGTLHSGSYQQYILIIPLDFPNQGVINFINNLLHFICL